MSRFTGYREQSFVTVSSAILANPVSVTHQGVSSYMLTLRPPRRSTSASILQLGSRLIRTQNWSYQRQCGSLHFDDALPSSDLPRRPHWQLQHFAQGIQVGVPWPAVIRLPEVNAGLGDTDLFSDFGNRQTTLDPSVAQVAAQTWFARQCY